MSDKEGGGMKYKAGRTDVDERAVGKERGRIKERNGTLRWKVLYPCYVWRRGSMRTAGYLP